MVRISGRKPSGNEWDAVALDPNDDSPEIAAFKISGNYFGALAVCMFYYSGSNWVPYTG